MISAFGLDDGRIDQIVVQATGLDLAFAAFGFATVTLSGAFPGRLQARSVGQRAAVDPAIMTLHTAMAALLVAVFWWQPLSDDVIWYTWRRATGLTVRRW